MKEIIKTIFESDIVNEALNVYIPNFLLKKDEQQLQKLAINIAESFGNKSSFEDILKDNTRNNEYVAIESFERNVKLLIDKTWVNQGNEFFKFQTVKKLEKLSEQLRSAFKNKEDAYLECFDEFFILLKEIIYLLFGKEVEDDYSLEYILHIEPHFGFFCYYVVQMTKLKDKTEEHARLAILIAVVFLSEF